jgi:DNA-binding transcriptional MerR regulator
MYQEVKNMDDSVHEFLEKLLISLKSIDYVRPEDIPNIDLYMDQVTTFMDEQLAASKRHDDDKLLTKTMINNYAKNDLLPPPVKKKYSKEHVLTLIFIYYFKNILSISDIQSILNPITEKYFGNKDGFNMQDIYTEVFSLEEAETQKILKDLGKKYTVANDTFNDFPEEDRSFLHAFSFICQLSYDVYIKKMIIERIIDDLNKKKED